MAAGIVLTKRWGLPAGVGPLTLTGWQLTAGGLLLLPLTLAIEGAPPRIDAEAAGGYLWLGSVGGLIASTLWFRGIGKLPVGASAPLVLLSPLVAAVIGIAPLPGSALALPRGAVSPGHNRTASHLMPAHAALYRAVRPRIAHALSAAEQRMGQIWPRSISTAKGAAALRTPVNTSASR